MGRPRARGDVPSAALDLLCCEVTSTAASGAAGDYKFNGSRIKRQPKDRTAAMKWRTPK